MAFDFLPGNTVLGGGPCHGPWDSGSLFNTVAGSISPPPWPTTVYKGQYPVGLSSALGNTYASPILRDSSASSPVVAYWPIYVYTASVSTETVRFLPATPYAYFWFTKVQLFKANAKNTYNSARTTIYDAPTGVTQLGADLTTTGVVVDDVSVALNAGDYWEYWVAVTLKSVAAFSNYDPGTYVPDMAANAHFVAPFDLDIEIFSTATGNGRSLSFPTRSRLVDVADVSPNTSLSYHRLTFSDSTSTFAVSGGGTQPSVPLRLFRSGGTATSFTNNCIGGPVSATRVFSGAGLITPSVPGLLAIELSHTFDERVRTNPLVGYATTAGLAECTYVDTMIKDGFIRTWKSGGTVYVDIVDADPYGTPYPSATAITVGSSGWVNVAYGVSVNIDITLIGAAIAAEAINLRADSGTIIPPRPTGSPVGARRHFAYYLQNASSSAITDIVIIDPASDTLPVPGYTNYIKFENSASMMLVSDFLLLATADKIAFAGAGSTVVYISKYVTGFGPTSGAAPYSVDTYNIVAMGSWLFYSNADYVPFYLTAGSPAGTSTVMFDPGLSAFIRVSIAPEPIGTPVQRLKASTDPVVGAHWVPLTNGVAYNSLAAGQSLGIWIEVIDPRLSPTKVMSHFTGVVYSAGIGTPYNFDALTYTDTSTPPIGVNTNECRLVIRGIGTASGAFELSFRLDVSELAATLIPNPLQGYKIDWSEFAHFSDTTQFGAKQITSNIDSWHPSDVLVPKYAPSTLLSDTAHFADVLDHERAVFIAYNEWFNISDQVTPAALISYAVIDYTSITDHAVPGNTQRVDVGDAFAFILKLDESGATRYVLAMDLESNGAWFYDNFDFNSYAQFNGKTYGLKDDGLYELGGATDNGADIAGQYVHFGAIDYGRLGVARPQELFFSGRSPETLTLRVSTPAGESYEYLAQRVVNDALGTGRFKLGKGFRAPFVYYELMNSTGAFTLDKLDFTPFKSARRIK